MVQGNIRPPGLSGDVPPDSRPGGSDEANRSGAENEPRSATGTGLVAAAVGALITSLPQFIEQLSPWNRAFLAFIALSLGLSVFGAVQARREAPRRRLWVSVSLAGGVVSVCTALGLGAGALLGGVTRSVTKVGYDDDFPLQSAEEDARVGTLPLDAGSYAISAKLYVAAPQGRGIRVTCRLNAENDYDIASADVAPGGTAPVALVVAHSFRDPGGATLECRDESREPGISALRHVKVLAIGTDSVQIEELSR